MKSLTKHLNGIAGKAMKGAATLMENSYDWQVIKEYLSNRFAKLQLTPAQEEKLKQYRYIYDQLASGKLTEKEVRTSYCKMFNISESQSYFDVQNSKELFAACFDINKLFEIKIQLELNRVMLQKAEEANDFKSYAALERNRKDLLSLLPDKEDIAMHDYKVPEVEAVYDPGLIGAPAVNIEALLKELNFKRGVKTNAKFIEDIKEVNEAEEPLQ